jgi:phage FluMu gp28-like protein
MTMVKPAKGVIHNKVTLPKLHKGQQQIMDDPATYKVLSCGRRWGKSVLARIMCLDKAINEGGQVWWVAPAYSTALDHWRATKLMVEDAPFLHYKNEQQKHLEFRIGDRRGSITFKSADKPDNLRGAGLDLVVLDEAAIMTRSTWFEILMPTLMDKQGSAMIISTPKGRMNWFYEAFQFGNEESKRHVPGWKSWHFPTSTSPYIDKSYIDMAKRTMPRHMFQQEILAIFQDSSGGVFNNLNEVCVLQRQEPVALEDQLERGVSYVMAVDWGRKNDFTVISVFDRNSGEQVDLIRFTDVGFSSQATKVGAYINKWNPSRVFVETNSMGMPMFERLRQEYGSSLIKGIYVNSKNKRELIERLAAMLETGAMKLLSPEDHDTQSQFDEFGAYRLNYTRNKTNITYSAPRSGHDDTVMAAALATQGIYRKSASAFAAVENPFY